MKVKQDCECGSVVYARGMCKRCYWREREKTRVRVRRPPVLKVRYLGPIRAGDMIHSHFFVWGEGHGETIELRCYESFCKNGHKANILHMTELQLRSLAVYRPNDQGTLIREGLAS